MPYPQSRPSTFSKIITNYIKYSIWNPNCPNIPCDRLILVPATAGTRASQAGPSIALPEAITRKESVRPYFTLRDITQFGGIRQGKNVRV